MVHVPPLRVDVAILLMLVAAGALIIAARRMRRRRRRPPPGIRVDLVGAAGGEERRG
jgi:membrane protein implicated in regulation of membrane protease activity